MFEVDSPVMMPKFVPAGYGMLLQQGGFGNSYAFEAETQKARGVFFLQSKSTLLQSILAWQVPKHLLFPAGFEFAPVSLNYPVFARPCPTVPRHGFVDSIICKDFETLNQLSKNTSQVESEAEILITKPVASCFNAIINDGVITFAEGNDGATSGRNCQYFYLNEEPLSSKLGLDPALLLEGEVPFYELVISKKGKVKLVQVRSAPGVPRAKDFIPRSTKVEHIIKAEGDLLEWEKKLKSIDGANTIIDHVGGSLSSHYAIHAIINQIPVFTTGLPELGTVVEPTVENAEITEEDRLNFRKAFFGGFNAPPYLLKHLRYVGRGSARPVMLAVMQLALATLHNFSAISQAKSYDILGLALGLFVRSTFAVSAGEARHAPTHTGFEKYFKNHSGDREVCYDTMFVKGTDQCISDIETIFYIFRDLPWGGSYGGPKWASCTESSIDLYNASIEGKIEEVVEKFNRVINEEHNGGKYLNKIIRVDQFDEAAQDPSFYALKYLGVLLDVLYTTQEYIATYDKDWGEASLQLHQVNILPSEERKRLGNIPPPTMEMLQGKFPELPSGYSATCTCTDCIKWHPQVKAYIEEYVKAEKEKLAQAAKQANLENLENLKKIGEALKKKTKTPSPSPSASASIFATATNVAAYKVGAVTSFNGLTGASSPHVITLNSGPEFPAFSVVLKSSVVGVWDQFYISLMHNGEYKAISLPYSKFSPIAYPGASQLLQVSDSTLKSLEGQTWDKASIIKHALEHLDSGGSYENSAPNLNLVNWSDNDKVDSVFALPTGSGFIAVASGQKTPLLFNYPVSTKTKSSRKLISGPFWWCFSDGTKVISKKKLSQMLQSFKLAYPTNYSKTIAQNKIKKQMEETVEESKC